MTSAPASGAPARGAGSRPRALVYVQHLMGIGHQHRAAAVARALAARGLEVVYVSGGMPVPGLPLAGVELVQLPPARAADFEYGDLVDEAGAVVTDAWRAHRRQMLLDTYTAHAPHVVVTETFPFGRGLMRFELVPLIERARGEAALVCSVRDIIERRSQASSYERMARFVEDFYDAVLVHADPQVIAFDESFPLAARIAHRLHYTGYVASGAASGSGATARSGEVVVSGGGGVVAFELLACALQARGRSGLAGAPWRLLVGPDVAPPDLDRLRAGAPAGVVIERNRPDFVRLLAHARVSVSRAGYNTVTDVLGAGVPAVLVPFESDGQHEQGMRARVLAARGLVEHVPGAALDVASLARAVDRAAGRGRRAAPIDLGGDVAAAASIEALARARRRSQGPLL